MIPVKISAVSHVGKIAFAGAFALFFAASAFAADRDDVLARIAPIGKVAIAGSATAAVAPAAAAKVAPAAAAPAPSAAPAATAVTAASGNDGAALFASKGCSGCHGADAKKTVMPIYPVLAGQSPAYLLAQMHDIKSGARHNGQTVIMKGVIAGVSDAEMQAIADWLSSL